LSELPTGWQESTLGECCAVTLGQSPPGSSYNEDGEGIAFFQGKAEFGELHPTVRKWTTAASKFAAKDDVIISVRAPVGPTNLAPLDCAIGRGLAAIHALGGMDSRYILYWLRSTERGLASRGTGTTFGAISGSVLRSHPIPVAPLPEQQRIVAAIEEQLSRLDAAEGALSSLRLRLVAARRSAIADAMRKPEWPRARIGDIGDGGRNALAIGPFGSNLKVSDYQEDGVPLVFVRNIRARQFGSFKTHFVSAEKAEELASHRVRHGDVLITKMGDPPGDTTVYPEGQPDAIITADCIKVSVGADFDPHFVALAIEGPEAHKQVLSYTQGVAQRKVSLGRFKKVLIPAPPLEVQHRVVAQLENFFNSLKALDVTAHLAERKSAALRSAILGGAFRGQLVPQDPDDEPASILLARIAAERTATPKVARRRRDRTPA
jgi:type I restriction enzyme, S subunit